MTANRIAEMMLGKVSYEFSRSLRYNDNAKPLVEINHQAATVSRALIWAFA
jgi:hypothetical protein